MRKREMVLVAFVGVLMLAGVVMGAASKDNLQGLLANTFRDDYIVDGGWQVNAEAKTASFTVAAADNAYIIDSSGGAITATLPAPTSIATGKTWKATLKTAGNAVTFSAAPFSIDGATSTNAMDAAGDSYEIMNTGAGYVFTSRYIH